MKRIDSMNLVLITISMTLLLGLLMKYTAYDTKQVNEGIKMIILNGGY